VKKSIFCLFLLVLSFSCTSNWKKESKALQSLVEKVTNSHLDIGGFSGVMIIPLNGCSSCITISSKFASENAKELKNVLFLFTEIRSTKELKVRFNLEPNNQNIIFDTENFIKESKLDFGSVGIYTLQNGNIIDKQILNLKSISQSLNVFKSKMTY
tara:strand:- start:315 stop:782 length:468 start_codon:yes stop_codon:yes gene_type:complete